VVGAYDNRMHRMMRQPPRPPPPPLPSSKSSGRPHLSRNSTRLANESIKPKKNNPTGNNNNNNNGYWWDVAHVTSRHYEQEQSTNKERRLTFRRIVKICVYVIFFCVVLTSAVVSKLSLFTMINAYKTREQVCLILFKKFHRILFLLSLKHILFDGKYFYLLQWVYHIY
jgi:hypothetical protein